MYILLNFAEKSYITISLYILPTPTQFLMLMYGMPETIIEGKSVQENWLHVWLKNVKLCRHFCNVGVAWI